MKRLYTSDMVGRLSGLEIGSSGAEYDADYFYAAATGRLERVTGPGLPSSGTDPGATYSHVANTHLVDKVEFVNSGSAIAEADYSYESERPLLTTVENKWLSGPTTISKYAYVNDGLGRRTSCVRTGSAFAGGSGDHFDLWSYNERNELSGSNRYAGTDIGVLTSPDTDADHAFTYDPIGNRVRYDTGDPTDDPNYAYAANALNQYTLVAVPGAEATGQRFTHDADGNLIETYVAADLDQDGDVDLADLQILNAAYGKCEGQQGYVAAADFDGDGCVGLADLQGLLGLYGQTTQGADLVWDAENRLVSWTPKAPQAGDQKVTFAYDYLSRRVEKKVFDWDEGDLNDPNDDEWEEDPSDWRKFVWYNWLLIEELSCNVSTGAVTGVIRKYTWGKDLSGSLEGAGGIGGLLATHDVGESDDYLYFYDANGNVGQLVAWVSGYDGLTGYNWGASRLVAQYEYDPYGNVIAEGGDYAEENPFRFSTKYWDDETGFGYWDRRYYDPKLGRWISRDLIDERGGFLLYNYTLNRPTLTIDALGLEAETPCDPQPKTYAIDGTAYTEYGSVREISNPSNVCYFCKDATGGYDYEPGVGTQPPLQWITMITGAGTSLRVDAVKRQICADRCSDCPPSQYNIVGWSRGAVAAMILAQRLNDEKCCCKWGTVLCPSSWSSCIGPPIAATKRVCCDEREVKINFLGLWDPVDMRCGDAPHDIPPNVANCTLIVAGVYDNVLFPRHDVSGDPRLRRLLMRDGDHGDVGCSKKAYNAMRKCACKAGVTFDDNSHPGDGQ